MNAAVQELGPIWNGRYGIGLLGQQGPEIGMMPTQFVAGRIAVAADAIAEFHDFGRQLFACHVGKIAVHVDSPVEVVIGIFRWRCAQYLASGSEVSSGPSPQPTR